jgi:hypothetical protein
MKCLNRIEMQEFVDREVSPAVRAEIINHLDSCEKCRTLLNQANEDKVYINKMISQVGIEDHEISIPVFIHPLKKKKTILLRTLAVAAVAIITGFVFLIRPGRTSETGKIPEAEIVMYEFLYGKDLNKLWHDKTQILIIQDEKGNVIQSIITN